MVNLYIHSMEFLNCSISGPITSSANNDVSMHLRGHIEEDTHVFLHFKISIFEIGLYPIKFNCVSYFLTSSTLTRIAGTSKKIPPNEK